MDAAHEKKLRAYESPFIAICEETICRLEIIFETNKMLSYAKRRKTGPFAQTIKKKTDDA